MKKLLLLVTLFISVFGYSQNLRIDQIKDYSADSVTIKMSTISENSTFITTTTDGSIILSDVNGTIKPTDTVDIYNVTFDSLRIVEVNADVVNAVTLVTSATTNLYHIVGGLHEETTNTFGLTTNYKTVANLEIGEYENVTLTDSTIVLPSNGLGWYMGQVSFSFSYTSNGRDIEIAVFGDDIQLTGMKTVRTITSTAIGNVSVSYNSNRIPSNTVLKVKIRDLGGTGDITLRSFQFSVARLP